MINAAVGGFLIRTPKQAYDLMEEVVVDAYQWQANRPAMKAKWIHNVDTFSTLSAQMEALNRKLDKMSVLVM